MLNDDRAIGEFIDKKRKEKGVTIRQLADGLGLSIAYTSDLLHGNRKSLKYEQLQKIAEILNISEKEQPEFYKLGGKSRGTIPLDIQEFMLNNPYVIELVREIKNGKYEQKVIDGMTEKFRKFNETSGKKIFGTKSLKI